MTEETRFLKTVKITTFLLILLIGYRLANAQERNVEHDQHLRYTEQGGELVYWRVENLPVRVCQMADYGEEWNDSIQTAIAEMDVVVPSVFSDPENCDVRINIVDAAPPECTRPDGSQAPACAEWGAPFAYPVNVYIERDFYQLATLLHELMHAYGVWFHPDRSDSVVSGYPASNWFLNSNLTQFDIDLLTYLYSKPAYTREAQVAARAVIDQQDQDYCQWVEEHLLTHELSHKYRCD